MEEFLNPPPLGLCPSSGDRREIQFPEALIRPVEKIFIIKYKSPSRRQGRSKD